MARSARKLSDINSYCITLKLADNLILSESDKQNFLCLLAKYKKDDYKVLSYNIFDKLICFVITELNCNLETAMRKITVSFVNKFNKSHNHTGKIFKDRFSSIPAENYDNLWNMVFDMHNMGGGLNSSDNYLNSNVIDASEAILKFGSIDEMLLRQEIRKNDNLECTTTLPSKIEDSDLEKYIVKKFGIKPTQLKDLEKKEVNSILKNIVKYTKASMRQIGRVTKLSLKYLWKFSKSLTTKLKKKKVV